jgi:hypothetical protein
MSVSVPGAGNTRLLYLPTLPDKAYIRFAPSRSGLGDNMPGCSEKLCLSLKIYA